MAGQLFGNIPNNGDSTIRARQGWFEGAVDNVRSRKRVVEFDPFTDNKLAADLRCPNGLRRSGMRDSVACDYWRIGRKSLDQCKEGKWEALFNQTQTQPESPRKKSAFAAGITVDFELFAESVTASAKKRALEQYIKNSCPSGQQISSQTEPTACPQPKRLSIVKTSLPKLRPALHRINEIMTGAQEILFDLARDHDATVRMSVAENPNTPLSAMWMLVEDECAEVRSHLADNEGAPLEILEILSKDKCETVVRKAQSTLRRLWETNGDCIAGGPSPALELARFLDNDGFLSAAS